MDEKTIANKIEKNRAKPVNLKTCRITAPPISIDKCCTL